MSSRRKKPERSLTTATRTREPRAKIARPATPGHHRSPADAPVRMFGMVPDATARKVRDVLDAT